MNIMDAQKNFEEIYGPIQGNEQLWGAFRRGMFYAEDPTQQSVQADAFLWGVLSGSLLIGLIAIILVWL